MSERQVDLGTIIAYVVWAIAWVGIVAAVVFHDQRIAWPALSMVAVAVAVDCRLVVARQHRITQRTLELQREAERHLASVQRVR